MNRPPSWKQPGAEPKYLGLTATQFNLAVFGVLAIIVGATGLIFFGGFARVGDLIGRGGPSPTETLRLSADNFRQVESFQGSYHVSIDADELHATNEGQVGYQNHALVYFTMALSGDAPSQLGTSQLIFIHSDLYVRNSGGRWYVLSPWTQGIRPAQVPHLGVDDEISSYVRLVGQLSQINQRPDDTIAGKPYLHYVATIEPNQHNASVTPQGEPTATPVFNESTSAIAVELWLNPTSYLPRKMTMSTSTQLSGQTDLVMAESGLLGDLGGRLLDDSSALVTNESLDFDYTGAIAAPQPPNDALPWRDLELPQAPCIGAAYASCLEAQTQIQSISHTSCDGSGKRVCLVPLGAVPPGLIEQLVGYYRDQYGLNVTVLTPASVPGNIANPLRGQIDAPTLARYVGKLFPEAYGDPNVVLIGITPLDLYDATSHFRYVFGIKSSPANPKAIISTFRMDPETYSEPPNDALLYSRGRKLLTKYIGLLYYGLAPSSDPQSPLYDSILGPDDLDNMQEPLPVSGAH